MNALSNPTVYSRKQQQHIQNSISRAISKLAMIGAAYETAFVCQNLEGEHCASKDLLEVTKSVDDLSNQLQFDLLDQVSSHLGAPDDSFDLDAIKGGNEAVHEIRTEYTEKLSKFVSMEAA